MMDLYGDAQIHVWREYIAILTLTPPKEADAFIEAARGPASDLASALCLHPMEVAFNITRACLTPARRS